jgi:hypothetical protein
LARQGQETRIAPFFCRVAGAEVLLLLLKDATSSCRSLPCAAGASQLAILYFSAYCVCRLIVLYDLHGELRRQRATPGRRRPPFVHNNTLFRTYADKSVLLEKFCPPSSPFYFILAFSTLDNPSSDRGVTGV